MANDWPCVVVRGSLTLRAMDDPTFGQRVRHWLSVRGMRPAALARALGVSRPTVHAWLNDTAAPRHDRLAAVAEALGVSQAEFFGDLRPPARPLLTLDVVAEAPSLVAEGIELRRVGGEG